MTDWFSVEQYRVFLPPQPLEALVSGVSNDIGRTAEIFGRSEVSPQNSRFNDEPIFAVFRFLDLEFMFQIVLSLFAIFLGYDAVSGEKERGTLRLSLANAVPRHIYILGKLIGSFLALAIPLLIAISLGCLILPILKVPLSGDEWLRLIFIICTGLLYFGAFLTLSIFISSMTERTSSSFLILLVIWIISVMIVPRASILLAGRAVEVSSVDEILSKKRVYSSQLWNEDGDKMSTFKPSNTEDPEVMVSEFNRFMGDIAKDRREKMNEFSGRLNEDRHNRQVEQQKLAFNLARISPATSLTLATSTLAGTSIDLKNHFRDEATEYQTTYADFIEEKTGTNPEGRIITIKIGAEDEEAPEPIDPTEIPEYVYKPVSLAQAFGTAVVDMGLLAIFNLVFFFGAFIAFKRYDVR